MMKQNTVIGIVVSLIIVQLSSSIPVEANPNPFPYMGEIPPDNSTKPPSITIVNSVIDTNSASIEFNIKVGESSTAFSYNPPRLENIYYTSDWDSNKTYIRQRDGVTTLLPELGQKDPQPYDRREFSYTLNLTSIPDGNHTITISAEESGLYLNEQNNTVYLYGFTIVGSKEVNILIDITPPSINIETFANQKFFDANVPLNFLVSEPYLKASYVLDGQNNITISNNSVLTNLPLGLHNLTVYAWDNAGNVGASETAQFSVEPANLLGPYPVTIIAALTGIIATLTTIVLLLYTKHRAKKTIN